MTTCNSLQSFASLALPHPSIKLSCMHIEIICYVVDHLGRWRTNVKINYMQNNHPCCLHCHDFSTADGLGQKGLLWLKCVMCLNVLVYCSDKRWSAAGALGTALQDFGCKWENRIYTVNVIQLKFVYTLWALQDLIIIKFYAMQKKMIKTQQLIIILTWLDWFRTSTYALSKMKECTLP